MRHIQRPDWATKWLRVLSLGAIDKIRNYLIAKPILPSKFQKLFANISEIKTEQR